MEPGRQMPGGENPAVEETRHGDLGGDWRVERLGGLLPPMVGVWKRIRGERGETHLGPLLRYPFRVERRGGRPALVYRPPFSALVVELSGRTGISGSGVRRSAGGPSGGSA